jgi:hypothetical protein
MAVLQISRIQVRRGLQEDLPQLSSAELGWANDTRQLFIGNGTLTEGTPVLGNTEILTQYSDIFKIAGMYQFSGAETSLVWGAGEALYTLTSPISVPRLLQDKLDDFVNFRDVGGIGDGVANEVTALNHAIQHLFNRQGINLTNQPMVRRTIHLPAGVYNLSGDFIRLLPYVKLKGDGKNSTFIIQTDPTQPYALSSCDSNGITGITGTIATSSSSVTAPGYFEIEDLTIQNKVSNELVYLDSVTDVYFNRVAMKGSYTTGAIPVAPSSNNISACVKIGTGGTVAGSQTLSSNITFLNCDFGYNTYSVFCDKNLSNVNIIGGTQDTLYQGICLSAGITLPNTNITGVKVTGVTFDNITNIAINSPSLDVTNIVSSFNTFKNVGGNGPAVSLAGKNCYSIGDMFDVSYQGATPGIVLNDTGGSFATLPNGQVMLGRQLSIGGNTVILSNNVTNQDDNLIVGYNLSPTIVEYSITAGLERRSGALKISTNGSSIVYDDEYIESNTGVGVTLYPTVSNGQIVLQYTSINTDSNVVVQLSTTSRSLM